MGFNSAFKGLKAELNCQGIPLLALPSLARVRNFDSPKLSKVSLCDPYSTGQLQPQMMYGNHLTLFYIG